jgi:hypothetical protein
VSIPYRLVAVLATLALAVGGSSALADGGGGGGHHGSDKGGRHGGQLIRSDLFGSQVDGPVLFGVQPGGKPWVIARGEARVRRSGRIKVRVRGLVSPGIGNPLAAIAATLVCNGQPVGTTAPAPFSPQGDARIDATLDLSSLTGKPCLAPAVLLNPAPAATAGATPTADPTHYIAATGA